MIKTLLKPAAFCALPVFIVFVREKNRVFGRNNRRALGQWNHLVLHDGFDFAGDFNDKFFRLTARFDLCIAGGFFQNKLAGFAVNPSSNFIKYAHILFEWRVVSEEWRVKTPNSLRSTLHSQLIIKINITLIYPTVFCIRRVFFGTTEFYYINFIPVIFRIYNSNA